MPGFLPLNATFSATVAVGPPVFRGVGSAGSGTTGTGLTLPSGHLAGDLLVLIVASTGTTSTPTGYTATNTVGGTPALGIFYKIDNGSETVPTISAAQATGSCIMVAYSNVNGTTPVVSQEASAASGTSSSAATTSITTSKTNTIVLSIFGVTNGTGNTLSTPASTTSRAATGLGTSFRNILVVDETQVGSGATTVRTSTVGNTLAWGAFSMIISTT